MANTTFWSFPFFSMLVAFAFFTSFFMFMFMSFAFFTSTGQKSFCFVNFFIGFLYCVCHFWLFLLAMDYFTYT